MATPSVVTPPPELPVRVTEPPELISTNFETVALTLIVPVVLCPKQVRAESSRTVASNSDFIIWRGIVLKGARKTCLPAATKKLTAGAMQRGLVKE